MINFFVCMIAFFVGIGLLTFFHEFGHFIVARMLGIKVFAFSIGFGKPFYRKKSKSGVEYRLSVIPFGGYVKMIDARDGPMPRELKPYIYEYQPVWKRILVVLAGPVFNFILAIGVYWLMFMIGIQGIAPMIGEVTPGSMAERSHLKPMMEIIAVDGKATPTWQEVSDGLVAVIGESSVKLTVKEHDSVVEQDIQIPLTKIAIQSSETNLIAGLGIKPYIPSVSPTIGRVVEGGAAEAAGVLSGDSVKAINSKPIGNWQSLLDVIAKSPNKTVTLKLDRQGKLMDIPVLIGVKTQDGTKVGVLGVELMLANLPQGFLRKEHYGPIDSFKHACKKTYDGMMITFTILKKMLVGDVSLKALSGPIMIAEVAGGSAQIGFVYYLSFLGLISISLGVLNLLPIPVLDGGHLVFYIIESIRGRPASEKSLQTLTQIGIVALICLMSIAFYNDIARALGG